MTYDVSRSPTSVGSVMALFCIVESFQPVLGESGTGNLCVPCDTQSCAPDSLLLVLLAE